MAKRKLPVKANAEKRLRKAVCDLLQNARRKAGWSYRDLAERMAEKCVRESGEAIRQQLYRGTFSATFLLRAMEALEIYSLPWEELAMPEQAERMADAEHASAKAKNNQKIKSRYGQAFVEDLERRENQRVRTK